MSSSKKSTTSASEEEFLLDEEFIHSILQQELLKLKKSVMEGLRKEMKEMILLETLKNAPPTTTPTTPTKTMTSPKTTATKSTLDSITKTLETDIVKVRTDLRELMEKLPDPRALNKNNNNTTTNNTGDSAIALNVGGHIFETRISTLRRYPTTLLGMMASGHPFFSFDNHRPKGDQEAEPFFDRNSVAFEHVLEFYRTGALHRPPSLAPELWKQELDFWNIPSDVMISEDSLPDAQLQKHHKHHHHHEKKKHKKKKGGSNLWFDAERKESKKRMKEKAKDDLPNHNKQTLSAENESWRLSSPRWENDKNITKGGSLLRHQQKDKTQLSDPSLIGQPRTSSKETKLKRLSVQNIFATKSAPALVGVVIEKDKKRRAMGISSSQEFFLEDP